MENPFRSRSGANEGRCARPGGPFQRATPTDLATAILPRLMYERLEEMGLDFSVVYPTIGLITMEFGDDEVRRAVVPRAQSDEGGHLRGPGKADDAGRGDPDAYAGGGDRRARILVRQTRAQGRDDGELREAADPLRRQASFPRPPNTPTGWTPSGSTANTTTIRCGRNASELGIAPTFHSVGYGWGARRSISNYVYNHIGNFAASAEAVCKSLLAGRSARSDFPASSSRSWKAGCRGRGHSIRS